LGGEVIRINELKIGLRDEKELRKQKMENLIM
jgi:hypothetical protein